MKIKNILTIISVILFSLFVASVSFAAYDKQEKTKIEDVKEEFVETYGVMKDYTLEQRDEAITAANRKLKQLDSDIDEMEQKVEREWDAMSNKARQDTRQTLQNLRQQREKLAEWYGGMLHSSAKAWDEVKKGFSDSYDRLEKALAKAVKAYGKEN